MQEYKGIYYGEDKEQKFFEGGAHFKYSSLYMILEYIAQKQKETDSRLNNSESFKKNIVIKNTKKSASVRFIIYNFIIQKTKKSRNFNNFSYVNKTIYETQFINIQKRKENLLNNQRFLNSRIKYNSDIEQKSVPKKKKPTTRNLDSTAFKGKPNTILNKKMKNILIQKKNNKDSLLSFDNRSTNKSVNKDYYKKNLPDIYNKSDLTERKYSKKVKSGLKKIKILHPNRSALDVDIMNNYTNDNNQIEYKTNRIISNNNRNMYNNQLNTSNILNKSIEQKVRSNILKTNNKVNNNTQPTKNKVRNIIKQNKYSQSNNLNYLVNPLDLINIKIKNNKKIEKNKNESGMQSRNHNISGINMSNNKKLNRSKLTDSYNTVLFKSGIETYRQKKLDKDSLIKNKLLNRNNEKGLSNENTSSNITSRKIIKIKQKKINNKNYYTDRDSSLINKNKESNNTINTNSNYNTRFTGKIYVHHKLNNKENNKNKKDIFAGLKKNSKKKLILK